MTGLEIAGRGESVCPYCGQPTARYFKLDDAAAVDLTRLPEPPEEGSVSICAPGCGRVSVFTGVGLAVRLPTADERAEIEADPNIASARDALRRAGRIS